MTAARWQAWAILVAASVALVVAAIVHLARGPDAERLERSQARKRAKVQAELKRLAPDLLGDEDYTVVVPAAMVPAPLPGPPLALTIAADGSMRVDGERVDDDALARRFAAAHDADPDTRVIIQADQQVGHGQVVAVMEAAKAAGLNHLALTTAAPP